MLYDIIYAYEWFLCYNWQELCPGNKLLYFSGICGFLVKHAIQILNLERALTPSRYAYMQIGEWEPGHILSNA